MNVTVEFNASKYLKLLDKIDKKLDNTVTEALEEMGQELLDKANAQVPVDTGRLKASGRVEVQKNEVTVGYHTEYAAVIHEKRGLHLHNGSSKYLEDPLKTNLTLWQKIFARKLEKIL